MIVSDKGGCNNKYLKSGNIRFIVILTEVEFGKMNNSKMSRVCIPCSTYVLTFYLLMSSQKEIDNTFSFLLIQYLKISEINSLILHLLI